MSLTRRFLACSGGGDRGIVLLGMVKQLAISNGVEAVKYDMMAGISSGSLITSLLSTIDVNNFFKEIDEKVSICTDPNFQVVSGWTVGEVINLIDAIMFHQSIYNSTPLKNMIDKHFSLNRMKIPFVVGAYNKTLSQYETLNPTPETVLASCSLPIILPHVSIEKVIDNKKVKHDYEDGAVKHIIPVDEIKAFVGQSEKKCHIDVLVCFPINNTETFYKMLVPENGNTLLRAARRSLADVMLNVFSNDLNNLAQMMNVPYEKFIEHPYNEFIHNNISLQIISPEYGWHSNFLHMNRDNSLKLFQSGMDTVNKFMKTKSEINKK